MACATWNSCGGRTRQSDGSTNENLGEHLAIKTAHHFLVSMHLVRPLPLRAKQVPRLLSVTCLALMSYSQDSDNVECGIETIESEISSCLPRDHEFANLIVYSSSDVRMCFENVDCAPDVIKRLCRSLGRGLHQELDNTLKVGECLVRVGYLR